ncbi:hypothetical protein [Cellulomonas soli]|uniref:Uncharacterized protein n=1 Tax=Cellulomonas soli TaxID=931535 RepID=A0A512PI67_9CELL|nr:hypothetical protein [Cellulomonas soli]NYI58717.1 hypothetical protein [Cellulomonas soli]GEP70900.1 hypothetical protein CSO01_36150 [Cellulomonas soli]
MESTGDEWGDLVDQLREQVTVQVPHDVDVRPTEDGFAVGYPEPLVMRGPDGPSVSCLWSLVRCEPSTMTFQIVDVVTEGEASWFEGSLTASGFRGRVSGDRSASVYGTLPDGSHGLLEKRVHSAKVLHTAIREPAAALGWQEKQPASAIVGKTVAIVTGIGLLLGLGGVAALALTGRLG